MKTNKNEETAHDNADLANNVPLFTIVPEDRNDEDDDNEDDDNEDDDGTLEDWGDIDPAGGDPPTSPGSAV